MNVLSEESRNSNPKFQRSNGWNFEVIQHHPFRVIAVTSPFGRLAVVSSFSRNPENILYELCEEIIHQQTKENYASQMPEHS